MDFKILAIKPLTGCTEKYKKVLRLDRVYYIYNNYTITDDSIRFENDHLPDNLFSPPGRTKVSVSAIVGRNGSGKSTLVELLYAGIYIAAVEYGIVTWQNTKTKYKPAGISVDIYWQRGNDYFSMICHRGNVSIRRQTGKKGSLKALAIPSFAAVEDIRTLFYTIAVNYSHYSLNSTRGNRWLKEVFHKNDGYQLPLVINPFRNNGIIDINNEESLMIPRIVTNLLTIKKDGTTLFTELAPERFAEEIKFSLNTKKVRFTKNEKQVKLALEDNRSDMLRLAFREFDMGAAGLLINEPDILLQTAFTYILRKLYLITQRYKPYQSQSHRFLEPLTTRKISSRKELKSDLGFNEKKFVSLLNKLKSNPSHITVKLLQALNFVRNIEFYRPILSKFLKIEDFAVQINDLNRLRQDSLITVIPPSFFKVDIKFKDNGYLHALSSGEKQRMYTTASWVYHLLNLVSVKEDLQARYNRYNCINLIFDEIELYYHPEMQRTFVNDFMNTLNNMQLPKELGINCIFITHSPFILSDIPNNNILFLTRDGLPDEIAKDCRTFGANIHELLKNNFFLDDGTMGKFAQIKIRSVIEYLQDNENIKSDWDKQSADDFINMVSEPIIRRSMRDLYNKKFKATKTEIERQIELLQKELENQNTPPDDIDH